MYVFIGIFLIICIMFFYFHHYRKPCAIRKIRCLCMEEKCRILCGLISPMGFCYDLQQDIFVSRIDAWQRSYGYCSLFDRTAPFFQMVFDCEPVFFDYQGSTWRIEIWKGQYGINTGCEVGIYRSDRILTPHERTHAHFHAVSEQEMLPIRIKFYKKHHLLFTLSKRHWWLSGFCMGAFSEPEELQMTVSLTFPDYEMLCAFMEALSGNNRCPCEYCTDEQTITFCFDAPAVPQPRHCMKIRCAISQWKNRLFCRIYCLITRPFCQSIDRLLYLYYFLPFAFRRMITIRKPRKRWRKKYEL